MTSVLPFVVVFVVLLALAVFIWIWWMAPRSQVPPHLTDIELRRLEVEDRLRQTNYQILTALGLGATVIATVFQLTLTSHQWREDYQLRSVQERLGRYADALKSLDNEAAGPANISGIGSLFNLALQDPANYHFQVNEVLSTLVRQRATKDGVRRSGECQDYDGGSKESDPTLKYERSEARPDVQAAVSALGHPQFAIYRQKFVFPSGACEARSASRLDLTVLRLDHRYLDELDMSSRDFSCADLTQSHFRRTSFNSAILRGTDFGGARIADFEIPGFRGEDPDVRKMFKPDGLGWMLYRCRVTDFRGADLTNANFEGAALGGSDFRGANLTGANFCRADVSRANFDRPPSQDPLEEDPLKSQDPVKRQAELKRQDQLRKLLADACVGAASDAPHDSPESHDDTAQPFGINFTIYRCSPTKICRK